MNREPVELWIAMADHFLDTETRQHIPYTAWQCVQEGLTVSEARRIWTDEVTPAVGWNLMQVAGEWAGWDTEWLAAEVQKVRGRHGLLEWLRRRPITVLMNGTWTSIARCMELLLSAPEAERQALFRAMSFLAHHAFDFCPQPQSALEAEVRQRVRAFSQQQIQALLSPALLPGEASAAYRRLADALAGRPHAA